MKRTALYAAKVATVVVLGGVAVRRLGPRWVLQTLVLGVLDELDRFRDARD
jgi:hypothetical protein